MGAVAGLSKARHNKCTNQWPIGPIVDLDIIDGLNRWVHTTMDTVRVPAICNGVCFRGRVPRGSGLRPGTLPRESPEVPAPRPASFL